MAGRWPTQVGRFRPAATKGAYAPCVSNVVGVGVGRLRGAKRLKRPSSLGPRRSRPSRVAIGHEDRDFFLDLNPLSAYGVSAKSSGQGCKSDEPCFERWLSRPTLAVTFQGPKLFSPDSNQNSKMPSNNDKIALLIKQIKSAPGREWVNSYFDLVKRVLVIANLDNDDPRLAMSLTTNVSGWHFPVSVNNRYVIAWRKSRKGERGNLFVGLIFNHKAREIQEIVNSPYITKWGQYNHLPGENSEPPYLLYFTNLPELLYLLETGDEARRSWKESILLEVQRAKASPYRKFHEPLMYRMATDINFRAAILDQAYEESKPKSGLLPEEVDTSQKFTEGALKTVTINAYERNKKARQVCIEYYGTTCVVCGMSFEKKYGEIGKGFIHVHHIKPLGTIGARYKVDPIKDLRPVCPNCHAMLHMRKPPYEVDELKAMLKDIS